MGAVHKVTMAAACRFRSLRSQVSFRRMGLYRKNGGTRGQPEAAKMRFKKILVYLLNLNYNTAPDYAVKVKCTLRDLDRVWQVLPKRKKGGT